MASYLKSKSSHEVKVIDAYYSMNEKQFLEQIKKEKPDVIGFSCTTYTFLKSMELLKKTKNALPDTTIVLGGIHATFFADKILKNYKFIDFVVRGEGEIAFTELVNNLGNRKKLKKVNGLALRDKGKIISNEPSFISDLDSLPLPDRRLLGDNDYSQTWFGVRLSLGKFTTLLTSRGCPHNCNFCCCSALFKKRWRTRSVKNILDELEEMYLQGYGTCIIVDDNFTLNPKRVVQICRGIRKRKIKMNLHCEGRVDRTDPKILKEMRKAGFSTIYFGMESGVQKALDYYKKGIKVEQIKNAVRNVKKARMNAIGSFIIGSPVETKEDVIKTLEFATELKIGLQINILELVPGSEIWMDNIKKMGKDDWKRAHFITKFYDNFTRKEMLYFRELGYKMLSEKWMKVSSVKELPSLMTSYNVKVIISNISKDPYLFVKQLIKIYKEGLYPFKV